MIDLDGVSFIDSSGMRALIVIERRAGEERIALAIAPPPAAVTELLQVTGLADRIPLTPRAEDAPPSGPFLERIEIALARNADAPARARAELRQAILGRLSDRDSASRNAADLRARHQRRDPSRARGRRVGRASDHHLPRPRPRRGHRRGVGLRAGGPAAAASPRGGRTRPDRRRRAIQPLGKRLVVASARARASASGSSSTPTPSRSMPAPGRISSLRRADPSSTAPGTPWRARCSAPPRATAAPCRTPDPRPRRPRTPPRRGSRPRS